MISFVYFDLGGVVILDFSGTDKWQEVSQALGFKPDQLARFNEFWAKHCQRACLDFDVNRLVPLLRSEMGIQLPENFSVLDQFVSRFEPNPSIWPIIQQVQKTKKIGLLTNLYPNMLSVIEKEHRLLPPISWDAIVDSSVVGAQKPEKEIYEIAMQKAGVPAEEILFIDNVPENIAVPKELGWHTLLYDPSRVKESNQAIIDALRGN